MYGGSSELSSPTSLNDARSLLNSLSSVLEIGPSDLGRLARKSTMAQSRSVAQPLVGAAMLVRLHMRASVGQWRRCAPHAHAAKRHASARGEKKGATRHPGKQSTQIKSHLVAIIPLHAWGPNAALRAAICAPGAAWRPAAANYMATHLRTRREVRG